MTSNSVEEDILERAKRKMVLDHLVIQVGAASTSRENRPVLLCPLAKKHAFLFF